MTGIRTREARHLIIFSPHTRRAIHVTSLATGRSAVVVAGVAGGVASVAVDPARGRLYWASPGAVTTATLAGDTVEDILTRWVDNTTLDPSYSHLEAATAGFTRTNHLNLGCMSSTFPTDYKCLVIKDPLTKEKL